ncbi:MAG: holo-ACP synthase [Anaerorhabdus sp.]
MICGVGCDIVAINRIAKQGTDFAKRILTSNEYQLYDKYNELRKIEFLAGRFAAKEAIIKAIDKKLLVSDIEILYDDEKPVCYIDGYRICLSIAHEIDYAIAYAICEKEGGQ